MRLMAPLVALLAAMAMLTAAAAEPVTVVGISPAQRLLLADGREVILAGVVMPDRQADEALARLAERQLEELTADHRFELVLLGTDRHSTELASLRHGDGPSLAEDLVAAGWAWSAGDGAGPAASLLAAEASARDEGRGLWGLGPGELRADAIASPASGFALVLGRVLAVAERGRYVYLNFGADWRSDFTVRALKQDMGRLRREGLDLRRLAGAQLRVRGWLADVDGPMIELRHRDQIELLP
jgi:micrococcal nuclease